MHSFPVVDTGQTQCCETKLMEHALVYRVFKAYLRYADNCRTVEV